MRRGSIATLELLRLRTAGVPLDHLSQLRCEETFRLVGDAARAEATLDVETARRRPALQRWIESEPCRDGLRASVEDPRQVLAAVERTSDVAAPEQRLVVELLQRASCICDGYASLAPSAFGRLAGGSGPNLRVYEQPGRRRLFLDSELTRKLLRLCGSPAPDDREVMRVAAEPSSLEEEPGTTPEVREWLHALRRLEQTSEPDERDDLHRTLARELVRLTDRVDEPQDGRVKVEGRPAHAEPFVEAVMRPVGVDVGGRLAQEIHTIVRTFAAFEARVCTVLARRLAAVPARALWADVDDRPDDVAALLDAAFDEAEAGLLRDVARHRRLPDLHLAYPLPPPFSLDVAISAPDADAIEAGSYRLVLGEVHVEMTGLTTKSYFERDAFVRELAALFASYGHPIRFSAFENVHEDAFRARIAAFLLASAFEALDGTAGRGEPKVWPYRGKPASPPELDALLYFPLSVASGARLFYSRRRFLRDRRLSSCWFPDLVRRVLSQCDPGLADKLEHRGQRSVPGPPVAAGRVRDGGDVVAVWGLAESWRRAHGIPRAAYFHLPEAVSAKPIYVDFAIPELVLTLLDRCRESSDAPLRYSEMSPPPDRLWFEASDGRCCSELRTQSFAVLAPPGDRV